MNFKHGFALMRYCNINFISNISKNGRPIHAPSALQFQSDVALVYMAGNINLKIIKCKGTNSIDSTLIIPKKDLFYSTSIIITPNGEFDLSTKFNLPALGNAGIHSCTELNLGTDFPLASQLLYIHHKCIEIGN